MSIDTTRTPTASIIIAAYNRADVLRYAIKSVLQSSYSDWELIVIGDHCTDHTEATVRSFADPRITFENLPQNSGSQSTPHNVGVAQARGRYVLFLNQDDMYCADHLERAIEYMEQTGADFSWSPWMVLSHSGRPSGPPDPACDRMRLEGAVYDGQYDARRTLISSVWIVKRDVFASVGPWKVPREALHSPSQEWLFRAWRMGLRFGYQQYPSVLCVYSGAKRLSYLRDSPEHERAWSWIAEAHAASAALMRCVAVNQAELVHEHNIRDGFARAIAEVAKSRAATIAQHSGLQPYVLRSWLLWARKGAMIAKWRALTSEPDPLATNSLLRVGQSVADRYLTDGWHSGEASGRWTSGRKAEVIFKIDQTDTEHALELTGHPLRIPDSVTFLVNGQAKLTHRYSRPEETVRIDLGALRGNVRLTIVVETPTSQALNASGGRIVGVWVSSIKLVPMPAAFLDPADLPMPARATE